MRSGGLFGNEKNISIKSQGRKIQMKLTEPNVLNPSEIETIHTQSLTILERAGVRVLDTECRKLLLKAGAKIDSDDDMTSRTALSMPWLAPVLCGRGMFNGIGSCYMAYTCMPCRRWLMFAQITSLCINCFFRTKMIFPIDPKHI